MAKDSLEKTPPEDIDEAVEAYPVATGGIPGESETLVEVIDTTPLAAEETPADNLEPEPSVERKSDIDDDGAIEIIDNLEPEPSVERKPSERREIVKSASLVMLGNLGSSVLGMVRQIVVASTGPDTAGPFLAALSPAQKFNDFVINGSVQGVLIPTFNDYAEPGKREELRRLVFTIVNLIAIVMACAALGFLFIAPWFTDHVLATKYTPAQQILTINYARIVFFSLIGLGPFAVLQGALYAQKEFGWTALAAAAYHVGIIVGAIFTSIVGDRFLGSYGIALGVILGSVGEIALLVPGMRRLHLRYMFVLDLKHPALRKILKLYAPIAFSFFTTSIFGFLDQFFATQTRCAAVTPANLLASCGAVNFSSMGVATFLIQFPSGLVASALSFAVLPTLTGYIREGNIENFKNTLLLGFRLGLLLMIPAAAGFEILGLPIIKLIFEHGKFPAYQSVIATSALQNYAYQLPFIAIDQLLIVAFYARKNTLIPVGIGVVSLFGYLAVALPFWSTIGMPALAFANSVQNSLHAVLLLIILRIVVGPLHLGRMIPAILKILCAAAMMILVAWGLQLAFAHVSLFSLDHLIGRVLTVVVVGGISAGVYFGVAMLLKVEEVGLLRGAVMAKLGKNK